MLYAQQMIRILAKMQLVLINLFSKKEVSLITLNKFWELVQNVL